MTTIKFTAKSANARTDDWPFWMVWDGTMNVTGQVAEALGYPFNYGAVFSSRQNAIFLSKCANEKGLTL